MFVTVESRQEGRLVKQIMIQKNLLIIQSDLYTLLSRLLFHMGMENIFSLNGGMSSVSGEDEFWS